MARERCGKVEAMNDVTALSALVLEQLHAALTALEHRNLSLADTTVRRDADVNAARYRIETTVESELVGSNELDRVREHIATLSVINDLERIGDHAEGIAKIALMLGDDGPTPPHAIFALGNLVESMFERGTQAFDNRDVATARALCTEDDIVDAAYDDIYSTLLATMTAGGGDVIPHTYLLWVAHNLERIADRVTNICERTVYLVTGTVSELNVSNY